MKQILHYPRLDTILSVEAILKRAKTTLAKNEIDRRLDKQIMRQTLNVILEYLEDSNKIISTKTGILWISENNISKKLKEKLKKGVAFS